MFMQLFSVSIKTDTISSEILFRKIDILLLSQIISLNLQSVYFVPKCEYLLNIDTQVLILYRILKKKKNKKNYLKIINHLTYI